MTKSFTTNLLPGEYDFPIVIYSIDIKETKYTTKLSLEDIESILKFLLELEDIGLIWAFREYNETLYDSLTENIEKFLTEKKLISDIDEYGITFPVELTEEAQRIRMEE